MPPTAGLLGRGFAGTAASTDARVLAEVSADGAAFQSQTHRSAAALLSQVAAASSCRPSGLSLPGPPSSTPPILVLPRSSASKRCVLPSTTVLLAQFERNKEPEKEREKRERGRASESESETETEQERAREGKRAQERARESKREQERAK